MSDTEAVRTAAKLMIEACAGLTNEETLGAMAIAVGSFMVITSTDAPLGGRRIIYETFQAGLVAAIAAAHEASKAPTVQ